MLVMGFFVFLSACVADVEASHDALVDIAGFKTNKIFPMTDRMARQMEPTSLMSSANSNMMIIEPWS